MYGWTVDIAEWRQKCDTLIYVQESCSYLAMCVCLFKLRLSKWQWRNLLARSYLFILIFELIVIIWMIMIIGRKLSI